MCLRNTFPPVHPEIVPYNFTELNAFNDCDLGALIVQENATTTNFFVDVVADLCPNMKFFLGNFSNLIVKCFLYTNSRAIFSSRDCF